LPKLARNQERDAENEGALRAAGWRVVVIWECETRSFKALECTVRAVADLDAMRPARR